MQRAILDKLKGHLGDGIAREADIVYLLVEIGKYLEQETELGYSLLRFYRNWVAHSSIGNLRLAGDIPIELDGAVACFIATAGQDAAVDRINDALSMERLRSELAGFLEGTGLPMGLVKNEGDWRTFAGLLIRVLADVPLVFRGFDHITRFEFTEIEVKGDVENKVATWLIEASGYVLQGGMSLR